MTAQVAQRIRGPMVSVELRRLRGVVPRRSAGGLLRPPGIRPGSAVVSQRNADGDTSNSRPYRGRLHNGGLLRALCAAPGGLGHDGGVAGITKDEVIELVEMCFAESG